MLSAGSLVAKVVTELFDNLFTKKEKRKHSATIIESFKASFKQNKTIQQQSHNIANNNRFYHKKFTVTARKIMKLLAKKSKFMPSPLMPYRLTYTHSCV